MNPMVSIIVPVYNVERYLVDCLESISNQTLTGLEIILIDDGSQDNSGKICDEYAQKDKRIRVIHKQNGGPSSARNLGIKNASGRFIGFVDSDDTIELDMYEKLYNIGICKNADIIACGYVEINNFTGKINKAVEPLGKEVLIEGENIFKSFEECLSQKKILGYTSMCNKLYKRSYIVDNGLLMNEKIKIAEDYCFNLIAISGSSRICAINEPLYRYRRINEESIMNKTNGSFYLRLEARNEIVNIINRLKKLDDLVVKKNLQYENCNTVGEYLARLIELLKSEEGIIIKSKRAMQLLQEEYLKNSIHNYDKTYLLFKARLGVNCIKVIIHLEFKFKFLKKYF